MTHPDESFETPEPSATFESTTETKFKLRCIVAHKGTSIHCGHYVVYLEKKGKWYLYNDEKVVELEGSISTNQDAAMGYIFLLERV